MNYAQLSAALVAYTENTSSDFAAQIPIFVQQAEQRIYNAVQFPSLRKVTTSTTSINNRYLPCPDDFLAAYSVAVVAGAGEYTYLLNKDPNYIREAYPSPTDTGQPKYYALFGPHVFGATITNELTLLLGPTPNAVYSIEFHYFYYPTSIVSASTTWLGDNFDSVLLYGSLVEAYTYMKGEADIMGFYETKYKEALGLAKRLGDGMERQDAYRSGQYRQAVV